MSRSVAASPACRGTKGLRGSEAEVVAGGRPWKVDGDVGVVVKGRNRLGSWIRETNVVCS